MTPRAKKAGSMESASWWFIAAQFRRPEKRLPSAHPASAGRLSKKRDSITRKPCHLNHLFPMLCPHRLPGYGPQPWYIRNGNAGPKQAANRTQMKKRQTDSFFTTIHTNEMTSSRPNEPIFEPICLCVYRCSSAFIGGYMISANVMRTAHCRKKPPISRPLPPKPHHGAIMFADPKGPVPPWLP